MFAGDHIFLNVALAALCSRRFNVSFVPVTVIMILVNLIDLDHLFYYHLHSPTTNSLTLYPLHVYSGVLLTAICLVALVDPKRLAYYFCAVFGIVAHMADDALAHYWHYSTTFVVTNAVISFIILFFILRSCTRSGSYLALFFFLCAQWFLVNFIILVRSWYFDPRTDLFTWIQFPFLIALVALIFWMIFNKKIEMKHVDK